MMPTTYDKRQSKGLTAKKKNDRGLDPSVEPRKADDPAEPDTPQCLHAHSSRNCPHGDQCTIHGHLHTTEQLSGRARRLREGSKPPSGPKKPTRYYACKSLLPSECGKGDHLHCSKSCCDAYKYIERLVIKSVQSEQEDIDRLDYIDLYNSPEEQKNDPPVVERVPIWSNKDKGIDGDVLYAQSTKSLPQIAKLVKEWIRLDGPCSVAAIEEQRQLNQPAEEVVVAQPPPPVAKWEGIPLAPILEDDEESETIDLNTFLGVPPNGDDEVSSIDGSCNTDPKESLIPVYETRDVSIFVNTIVPNEYQSIARRVREWWIKAVPFTRTTKAMLVNNESFDTNSEHLKLSTCTREEIKFFWKKHDQTGDLTDTRSGIMLHYLGLYNAAYTGLVYWDLVSRAMREQRLSQMRCIGKDNKVVGSVSATVTHYIYNEASKGGEHRDVKIMTNTLCYVINQCILRYLIVSLAGSGSSDLDFRQWGRPTISR